MQKHVFRDLRRIALPLMLGSFIQTLYNLTDAYFLGKLGKEELSAPSIVMNAVIFLVMFAMGLSAAGTTLISQSRGKGDQAKVDFYLGQITLLLQVVATLITLVGLLFASPLLRLLQTPDEVFQYALDYTVIIFSGIPFLFGFFIMHGAMRGIGNTSTPLKVQIVTVVLNVMLDPIMIFGLLGCPKMGVKGAAYATVFSRCVASLIAFIILIRGKHGMKLTLSNLKPDRDALLLLLRIGLPSSLGQSVASLGFMVLQGIVNTFGTSVIAAFSVGNRIIALANMPSMSISHATAALVGQSLGAKDLERTDHVFAVSMKVVLSFIVPAMTLTFLWGNWVTRFFVDDAETIHHGMVMFRVVSISVIFFALFNVVMGTFQGAGDTKPVMYLNIFRLWGVRLPSVYFFATILNLGPPSIWYGMFLSNIVCFALGFLWLRRGNWKTAVNVDNI